MKIGNVEIKGRTALAPMAGVTDRAFRELCVAFGASYVVGEMVSAKGISFNSERSKELMLLSENERPAAVQLFGSEPQTVAAAAVTAMEYKPDQLSYRAMIAQVRAASYRGNVLYYIGKSVCCQAQICGKCNFLQKRAKKQNAQVPKNLCVMAGVVSFELTARGFGDRCSTS